jgi:hypothetical protein
VRTRQKQIIFSVCDFVVLARAEYLAEDAVEQLAITPNAR